MQWRGWERGRSGESTSVLDEERLDPWAGNPADEWDFDESWQGAPRPLFLVLVTLTEEGSRRVGANPTRILEVNHEIEQEGCMVLAQYALLGKYDFVTLVEAPSSAAMEKVAIELTSRGTFFTLSMPALPTVDYVEFMKRRNFEELL